MKSDILSRIVETLTRHGSVSFVARIGGREITVGVSADPREAAGASAAPAAWSGWKEAPVEMAEKVAAGVVVSDATTTAEAIKRVMAPIRASPIGLSLEELATALDVRPRTRLKTILAALIKSGRLRKVGRLFRAADAVVRRGPKPRSADADGPRVPSAAKLAALAKARAALAKVRAERRRP